MSETVFYKLLAIFIAVAIGWFVGRMRWLGDVTAGGSGGDPARVLSAAAFYIFVPALLFRTTARVDFATLPWLTLAAFFIPVLGLALAVYGLQRARGAGRQPGMAAAPSVQAITAMFGNTLQVGVPMAAAVFGEVGLAIHITVVTLHALSILTLLTALVELDLARERAAAAQAQSLGQILATTLRNTVIHPVVLPVLAGLSWNALGLHLPAVLDEVLQMLGTAVVPLCLTLIGMSLAYYGLPKSLQPVLGLVLAKLILLPALVLVFAHWGLGLSGMPLGVVVMMAALPTGSNALIFAQRYRCLEGQTTAAIVASTLLFMLTAPLWLALLHHVNPGG
ncbi:AEC family transporter [Paucibacter sp. KBW04]|uniref:AEC family transporter n=1 Tax=Paucibacter sp. KBW04 TaxID=2153361 RepID=UPI000F583704|nr:AEC family transporter [Paucibacter sp. KBW04]RQO54765.1 AEC family transporter [Paucibacter sp. KBW04]